MNKVKLAYNSYVSQKEPISLVHFVTNRCNARCKHCFIDFDDPETFKGDLSLEEIDEMMGNFLGSSKYIYNYLYHNSQQHWIHQRAAHANYSHCPS